jgi:hypothetical protein
MMRTKQTFLLCLLLFLLTAGLANHQLVRGSTIVETATIQQLNLATDGLQFTLQTPPAQYDNDQLNIVGLEQHLQTPGAPALPIYTTFIALPPTGKAVVTVRPKTVTQQQLNGRSLDPAPEPLLLYHPLYADEFDVDDQAELSRNPDELFVMQLNPDPAIYGVDAFYPAIYYQLSSPMMQRDVRLVQLTLYPVHYNPTRRLLSQAHQLEVTVVFSDVVPQTNRPVSAVDDQHINSLRDLVLNSGQIEAWRSLPPDLTGEPTLLPIGQDTYKITVDQSGVYELTYQMLADAGMDVANVDPLTFEMLHRGEPVAYEFVGNPHDGFQPGEAIRFYGWVGLGSRLEDQFVRDNVFWLWANGQATTIGSRPSEVGYPQADYFPESLTFEENNIFFHTWTNLWDSFPNEPDAWYWDRLYNQHPHSPTYTYPITLPYPSLSGPDALVTVEYLSRAHQVINNVAIPHEMHVYLNDYPEYGSLSWLGVGVYSIRNVNVTATVPITAVLPGANTVTAVMATNPTPPRGNAVYTNRITVDYTRQFVAVDEALAFAPPAGGGWTFAVSDFTVPPAVVWDISDRLQPVAITGAAVSGTGPYTLTFGGAQPADSRFIVSGQLLVPLAIDQYIPPDLNPAEGVADWVAITHRDFLTGTNRLASHRADPVYGGLAAHVVDIEDVVNQYGYGLAMPRAINNYLRHALVHWAQAPSYLLLVGDATDNPRFETLCPPGFIVVNPGDCLSPWNPSEFQFVATDMVYEDRWNGRIPSDFTMSLLVGDDLIPDIAIGRLTAQTEAHALAMVNKIILYEENLLSPANYDNWLENVLFVSDRSDTSAGNFCLLSEQTGLSIAAAMSQEHLCAPNAPTDAQLDALRAEMVSRINAGISILNYRGHGSVNNWGGRILRTTSAHIDEWQNIDNPIVILSVDCLDAYFTWTGNPGLGETYHKIADKGSAAHWAATGLGTTPEHSILHNNFYRGLFDQGQTAIGDTIKYAKLQYFLSGAHRSQLYSFTLHGDPAMQLMRPDLQLSQQLTTAGQILPGTEIELQLEIANEGLYPALTSVVTQLPPQLTFVSASADVGLTVAAAGQTVTLTLNYGGSFPNRGVPYGETAVINVTLQVDPTYGGGTVAVTSTAQTPGLSLTADGKQATTQVFVFSPTVELNPFVGYSVQGGVRLEWTTVAEFNTQGFWVDRSTDGPGGPFTRLSAIGLIPATGSGAAGADYTALDGAAQKNQTYWYRLVEQKTEGFPLERLLEPVISITFDPPLSYLYLPAIVKP